MRDSPMERPDQQPLADARHEPADIGEGFIWAAAAVVLGALAACAILVLRLYPESRLDRTLDLPLPEYPEPRLQPDPPADWRAFRAGEMRQLNGAGWIDKARGTVHIPIEEAMHRVAEQGISGWRTPTDGPP